MAGPRSPDGGVRAPGFGIDGARVPAPRALSELASGRNWASGKARPGVAVPLRPRWRVPFPGQRDATGTGTLSAILASPWTRLVDTRGPSVTQPRPCGAALELGGSLPRTGGHFSRAGRLACAPKSLAGGSSPLVEKPPASGFPVGRRRPSRLRLARPPKDGVRRGLVGRGDREPVRVSGRVSPSSPCVPLQPDRAWPDVGTESTWTRPAFPCVDGPSGACFPAPGPRPV